MVGGNKILRLNKASGLVETTVTGPAALNLRDVYYFNNTVYLCGTLSSSATVFGVSATGRGSSAGIVFKLPANLSGNAQDLATFGFNGFNTASSIVVDDAGGIYVSGHLGTGGAFASDFGLTGKWQARQVRSTQPVASLATAADVLNGNNYWFIR